MSEAAHFLTSTHLESEEALLLVQRASRIMQPSEPFDGVWQQEWNQAMRLLQELRRTIISDQMDAKISRPPAR